MKYVIKKFFVMIILIIFLSTFINSAVCKNIMKKSILNGKNNSWDIEIVDSEGDVGSYTSLTIGSDDEIHISYFDKNNNDYFTPE